MCKMYFPQYKKGRGGIPLHRGLTILEHLREIDLQINSECGGKGTCGKCRVRIEKGKENLGKLTEAEKKFLLPSGERLACQARIIKDVEDMRVLIKEFGKYEILKAVSERKIPLSPSVYQKEKKVFYNDELLDDYRGKIYGLAIDIGTTTLVFDLINLENGNVLATIAKTNPQISYGNDVISRIAYTMVDNKKNEYFPEEEKKIRLKELQKTVINGINESLKEIENRRGETVRPFIYEVVVVGNSTMRNIFFGIDVSSLGIKPYEPIQKEAVTKKAKEVGLKINSEAVVYGAPLIGGQAGADILANVLASGMYESKEISMVIDIGTNGEVVLGNSQRLISASAAAGGAFEGTTISSGLGAIQGAIKDVIIKDGKTIYHTIGDIYPKGICGSGLIDLLAELLKNNIMSKKAKIKDDFYVANGIKLTQTDIYQLITAKAGFRTDQNLLLKYYGIAAKDLEKVYLSGGFGNFINATNAMKIGLLPEIEEKRVVKFGNGALEGAREMLISQESREKAEKIVKRIEHMKPNEKEKDFDYIIAENMYFT